MTPIAEPSPTPPSSLLTRAAVAMSIAVHVAAVALSLGYAGAGIYESVPEAVAVNLVTPDEAPPKPQPDPVPQPAEKKPEPDLSQFDLRLSPLDKPPPQSQPQAAPPKEQDTKPPAPAGKPPAQQAKTSARNAPRVQTPPPPAAQPAYAQPQPDISAKYQVDLGLKELAAVTPQADMPKGNADFDDAATQKADIEKSSVAAFRLRLKECATLPDTVGPDDKVVIVLRATFTPDARLAAAPALIEASASAKGPLLLQAAKAALQACQPFAMLPGDKYQEWKVMDLRFTPQDFRRG